MVLALDCAYRTCINTCATVDAVVSIDRPFVTCFGDCAYRTGIITCSAVNALLGNGISQFIHLLLGKSPMIFPAQNIIRQ
ncbi:MAG: hypothetical protein H6Q57_1171 [Geobacteraceae bacterium]|nr:hypothetical protein [Geobacteraceae bacterium]